MIIKIYFLAMNLLALSSMYIDKKLAVLHRRRISEHTLLLYACLGGSIGSICGMYAFHHKTMKMKFNVGLPMILMIQIIGYFIVRRFI